MKKACGTLIVGLMIWGITACGELTLQTDRPFVQLLSDTICPEAVAQFIEVGRKPGVELPSETVEAAVNKMREARIQKGVSLEELAKIANTNTAYIASCLNAQHRLEPETAQKVADALGLDSDIANVLASCKNRRNFPCTIDPFLYRCFEVLGVYGDAMRDMFNEKFGDGIMSAIVFYSEVDKEVVGGYDWVVIRMKGVFLPYLELVNPGVSPPKPETGALPGMKLTEEQVKRAVAVLQTKKREKGLTLDKLSEITGRTPAYIGAVINGQHRLNPEAAVKLSQALDLDGETAAVLTAPLATRTKFPTTLDPFLYRLYEILGVYGDSWRDCLNEKFGDGIFSAITFSCTVDREEIKGKPWVVITWKGKFLPFTQPTIE